ncbi:MAG: TIGR00300 family protein [Nitrososphaeraceae archaeon]|nr:TIGR00300 family protein [Nitrososphaeraceae archaeon]MDW0169011.1 TIGR00300 family protein [Nitrososphaeraceae archaeon]MDW0172330.1 TIGR00300 family protein [Nitrososphaeraceae archaeon]MDW0175354.1 TIGR00300 family protein [Nitrososphaeraceae archaeon]MDW0178223.1 TIGR00300 family protein [Nitrososphaeraceae archaeon]
MKRKYEQSIEIKGHLIDSMILTRIFDKIMDLKGDFNVLEFHVGKKKDELSYARLLISGNDKKHLDQLLASIYIEGAQPTEIDGVILKAAPNDMEMPIDFYSTTNNATQIFLNNEWIDVHNMMMDKCIVVDIRNKNAECRKIRDIRKGDSIVTGEKGVRILPEERPREGVDIFQFMSSSSSSERPTLQIARKIARDIYNTKSTGGKIVVTAGPVVVHSGAAEFLAKMIRMGYIDGLLTGNALAVHDIENSLFGTSLGMNVKNGTLAIRGHRNHMQAINEVFRAGSIEQMVKKNVLKSGIMYECIKNNVQYALCGSIRDDGPIPGVITDVIEAQDRYREILTDTKMVLMLSTMLHSIAVGNMIPARVKVVAVDISQAVVTKLLDRGTTQAIGVVSDIGAFLPMVLNQLEQMSKK